jgi:arylsulfatase A-like enzyme
VRNATVIEAPVNRDGLTERYTQEVIDFITRNKDKPFFVYLPHAMPGSTKSSFAGNRFRGKSGNGTYGDTVEEIDWSTGEILNTLKNLNLDENTLVIWTSDNGAVNREHSSNQPLSGWGYGTNEGAMRVPCVVRWPGKIPAGLTSDELCSTMDLLPTFALLAKSQPPADRIIDGKDIRPLLLGRKGAKSPHEAFYYYLKGQLQAVRSGKWKLFLPLKSKQLNIGGKRGTRAIRLFDLQKDIGETTNVAEDFPKVVKRLVQLAETARNDLGDEGRPGNNQRPVGRVENPQPLVLRR